MQLNFFDHARDTMLRNDVVATFERGDAAAVLERAERRNANRAEQAFEAVASALRLERKGAHAELVAARARLRALDTRLFACYMRTR